MQILVILLTIFTVVFCLILLLRMIVSVLLERAYKKLKLIKSVTKRVYSKKKNYIKEDEELKREKIEFPRAHSEVKAEMKAKRQAGLMGGQNGQYEVMESHDNARDKEELNDVNIVDIVKPVGFWTSMIFGQKLTYLISSAQMINNRGDKGFWASMIEAKEREAGKQHSRGR